MDPLHVTIAIAVCTLIVVPLGKHVLDRYRQAHERAEAARLEMVITQRLATYVTTEEHEMQFQTLTDTQDRQHRQNQDFLETIRTEALTREGRVLGSIEALANATRSGERELRTEIANQSLRIDEVLRAMITGDRRRP